MLNVSLTRQEVELVRAAQLLILTNLNTSLRRAVPGSAGAAVIRLRIAKIGEIIAKLNAALGE